MPDSLFQEGDHKAVRFASDTVDVVDWGAVEIPDTTWAIQYGGEEEGLEGSHLPGANFIAVTDVFEFNVDPSQCGLEFGDLLGRH